ncbi:phosphoethanolamine transferase [Candidatus Arsenophonus triatominarum]|uniref:phosphoethanolamine transferase n=1 Tax=Candidatus Arsenophonus triatominarum TaxID=57911 RepID=UPI0007C54C1D|nr:phosphoethanolamine transferase [Candidatus Arsenophonus triatominarum]
MIYTKILKKNIVILLLIFLISQIINLYVFRTSKGISHISTFTILLITFVLIISNGSIKKAIGIFFLFFINLKIIYSLCFNGNITVSAIKSIFETNIKEVSLMFNGLFFKLTFPSLILTISVFFLVSKIRKNLNINPLFLNVTLISICLTFISVFINIKNEPRLIPNIKEDNKELGIFLKNRVPLVVGDIIFIMTNWSGSKKYLNISKIEKLNNSIIKKINSNNKNIILIMGEASLSLRYSVYGYHLNTTPHMAKIFSTEDACILNNVHSSAPITRDSVSMTLAFHVPESEDNLFINKSIVEMAKENGYKTYWIGAQEIKGLFASKYGFIAKKSDYIKLTHYDDNKLTTLLSEVLSDGKEKRFIVIHLNGNHLPYNNYDEIDKNLLPNAEKYDLTIHHVDRVVNDIFNVIDKQKIDYNLIYTADHGEIVNVGHGLEKGIEQYIIPFMYRSTNPDNDCKFIESFRNKNGYLSGLMNKYILSELLGYKIDKNVLTKEREYDRVLTANEEVVTFYDIK